MWHRITKLSCQQGQWQQGEDERHRTCTRQDGYIMVVTE